MTVRNAEPESVGAVADRGLFRIDLGFIGDVTAVAPSIDLHDPILYRLSFRYSRQPAKCGLSLNHLLLCLSDFD
jgi:hypothetical protein